MNGTSRMVGAMKRGAMAMGWGGMDFGQVGCGEVRLGNDEFRAAEVQNFGQLRWWGRAKARQRGNMDGGKK